MEFLILLGFMVLVFTVFFFVMSERSNVAQQQIEYASLLSATSVIEQEILIANQVHDGYNRTFEMPFSIDGVPYIITFGGPNEVTLTTLDYEYVLFLPVNVTILGGGQTISAGRNRIMKQNGIIMISPGP